jgi:hypothetical protein
VGVTVLPHSQAHGNGSGMARSFQYFVIGPGCLRWCSLTGVDIYCLFLATLAAHFLLARSLIILSLQPKVAYRISGAEAVGTTSLPHPQGHGNGSRMRLSQQVVTLRHKRSHCPALGSPVFAARSQALRLTRCSSPTGTV